MPVTRVLAVVGLLTALAPPVGPTKVALGRPTLTAAVRTDADDPAIWVNRAYPGGSLIIGTDKGEAPTGGLYVFRLDGKLVQRVSGLARPNNVDVEQGVRLGARTLDIAVATERRARRLRVYRISGSAPHLTDITGTCDVFAGEQGDRSEPMGIGLYRRSRDGAVFAIVSRKSGPRTGYLAQYRLFGVPSGKVNARLVRTFGRFSGKQEIESVCVDDALGYVYYSDELHGVRKYHADPDAAGASAELACILRDGYRGDHEGIAVVPTGARTGYIVSTEQLKGSSRYHVLTREGEPGRPHAHRAVAVLERGADDTDGIEYASINGRGVLVAMNSKGRNFAVYRWPKLPRP